MKKIILLPYLFCCLSAFAQTWQVLDSVLLPLPEQYSADRYGNWYIADNQGNIHQYDSTGSYKLSFSPEKIGSVTLLEARQTVRIAAFYRDFQEIVLLDRFLKKIESYHFDNQVFGFVRLATVSQDSRFWILDEADFALKKYDPVLRQVIFTVPLALVLPDQEYDFCFLAEYQNWLFLLDKKGKVLLFDNLGNWRQTFAVPAGIERLDFADQTVFWGANGELSELNFYTAQSKQTVLPNPAIRQVVLLNSRWVFFLAQKAFIAHKK